jgi:hypothetical protein
MCEPCEFHIFPMPKALGLARLPGQRPQFLFGGVPLLR